MGKHLSHTKNGKTHNFLLVLSISIISGVGAGLIHNGLIQIRARLFWLACQLVEPTEDAAVLLRPEIGDAIQAAVVLALARLQNDARPHALLELRLAHEGNKAPLAPVHETAVPHFPRLAVHQRWVIAI